MKQLQSRRTRIEGPGVPHCRCIRHPVAGSKPYHQLAVARKRWSDSHIIRGRKEAALTPTGPMAFNKART